MAPYGSLSRPVSYYLAHALFFPPQTHIYLSCLLESRRYFWFISCVVKTHWLLCCFDDCKRKMRCACVHMCDLLRIKHQHSSWGPFFYHNLTNTSTKKSATLKNTFFLHFRCSVWDYFFFPQHQPPTNIFLHGWKVRSRLALPTKCFFLFCLKVDLQLMRSG